MLFNNINVQMIFGICAGFTSFSAYLLYICSILKQQCKPNLFTWSILTLNGIIISITYYVSGAWSTLWVSIGYIIGTFIISILSIKFGEKKIGSTEWFLFISILVILFCWFLSGSAFIALLSAISIDFLGLLPTIKKSYSRPLTEDRIAWSVTFIANILNVFAIETWSIEISLYPIYLLIIDGIITILLFRRKLINKFLNIKI